MMQSTECLAKTSCFQNNSVAKNKINPLNQNTYIVSVAERRSVCLERSNPPALLTSDSCSEQGYLDVDMLILVLI